MHVHLLVVDDEPDLAFLIKQKFRKKIRDEGWEFSFASNGIEALEVLAEHQDIHLVLTDINMPGMDGLTLLDRIRALDRLVRPIVISAYGDMSNIRTAMNRGAFDFITKPVDFDDLEKTVDKTLVEIESYMEAMMAADKLIGLQKELALARRLQSMLVPKRFPVHPDASGSALLKPAREVGGDFYDYFLIDDTRIAFALGDVSGKGISAALFMAMTVSLLHARTLRGDDPAECLRYVNQHLFPQSLPEVFVTACAGILDTDTGDVVYATAGHYAPVLIRASGEVHHLERTPGIGLCLRHDFEYISKKDHMAPGDLLVLVTDGVTEARNADDTLFEDEGLERVLSVSSKKSAEDMLALLLEEIETFSQGQEQHDDITAIAIQYRSEDQ